MSRPSWTGASVANNSQLIAHFSYNSAMSLFRELKRRNVFKVATLYIVAGWLALQVADVLFEHLGVPDWTFRFLFGLLVICFPLVLLFSWVFEITPEGIRRESEVEEGFSIAHKTGQRINQAIAAVLVLAILAVIADRLIPRQEQPARSASIASAIDGDPTNTATPREILDKSIAVLPFVNMSGDPDNEFFSDGLAEELLNALSRLEDLKVAGRTSSFAFKGKDTDLRDIARQLNVAHLLEGSVRKSGNRVRITAQLISAGDGFHLWSDTFDRELDDIFQIQEEIAAVVADALQAVLAGSGDTPLISESTAKPEAYEAYLRGRYLLHGGSESPETLRRAEAEFLHALNLDPGFTLAQWGLFNVEDYRFRYGEIDYDQGAEQLAGLAARLMEEAPDLPESHLATGRAAFANFRFSDALNAYQGALDLNPGHLGALTGLGDILVTVDRPEQAIQHYEKALARDPLALRTLIAIAWAYTTVDRCDEVRRIRQRALAISPESWRVNGTLAYCLLSNDGPLDEVQELLAAEPALFVRRTGLAIAHHRLGDTEQAEAWLAELQQTGADVTYQVGQVYAQWEQPETAVEWLEQAYEIGDPGITLLLVDPFLRPLALDPGYLKLVSKWKNRGGL